VLSVGWWPTADGSGVVGDEPADVLGAAVNAAVAARARVGARPELAVLLADLAAAVGQPLRAELREGEPVEARGEGDPEAVAALTEAVAEIVRVYEQDWQRPPSLAELLETAAFVLAPGLDGLAGSPRVRRVEPA
jgi:hypothetical protein